MTTRTTRPRRHAASLSLALLLALSHASRAADAAWSIDFGGNWSEGFFWDSFLPASDPDFTAVFQLNFSSNPVINVDTPFEIGNLLLNDASGVNSSSITIAGSSPLTLSASTTPTIAVGLLLNAQNLSKGTTSARGNGKKAIITAPISGTSGFAKTGPGYLSWRGTKTLSGPMRVEGGVLEINGSNPNISSVVVRGGASLFLDFQSAGAASANMINTAAPLTLGGPGGSGTITNSASGTHSQTFAGVTLSTGAHQIVAQAASGQSMTYTLGTIVPGAGSTLNFATTGAGSTIFNITNPNGPNGILGSWATVNGRDWAIRNASGRIAPFTGYTADTWAPANHTDVLRSANLSSATTATLRFNTGANIAPVLRLTGTNIIGIGGIIVGQHSPLISGGTLTTGNATGDLIVHAFDGTAIDQHAPANASLGLRIESLIANNGTTPLRLVKAGTGVLTLTANNTYTGGTVMGAGTLIVGSGPQGSTTGTLGNGDITLSANAISSNSNTNGSYTPVGVLAFNRAGLHTITNNINAAINGGGFIAQYSPGTLVLNKPVKVGGLIAQAGTTRLDFSPASAPAAELIDGTITAGFNSFSSARLLFRSGGVMIQGKNGDNTVQSFALTELQGHGKLALAPGIGGTATIDLGDIIRQVDTSNGGATLALTLPPDAFVAARGGLPNTLLTDGGSAFATVNGTDWAAKGFGSTNIVPVGSVETTAQYEPTTSTDIPFGNADLDADDPTILFDQITASFRFSKSTANSKVTLDGSMARLGLGGILVSSAVGARDVSFTGGPTGTGSLTSYDENTHDLPIFQHSTTGKLTIAVPIQDLAGSMTQMLKAGAGELVLTSLNTYTGRTYLNEGRLTLTGAGQIGTSAVRGGSILVRNGELLLQDNAKIYTKSSVGSVTIDGTVFTDTGNTSIGQRTGEFGILTLRNNSLFDTSADFLVGDVNAKGVLNIADAAQLIARSFAAGSSGYAQGDVIQTGGVVAPGNSPVGDWFLGGVDAGSSAAIGIYNLSGGVLDAGNQNFQIGRNGIGTVNQTGGIARGTGSISVGRFHSGIGTWTISGGTLDATATTFATPSPEEFLIIGEAGTGTLAVSNSSTVVKARSLSLGHDGGFGTVDLQSGLIDLTQTTPLSGGVQPGVIFGYTPTPATSLPVPGGTLNLNGGTLKAFSIAKRAGSSATATVNLNGGTIMALGNNSSFIANLDGLNVKAGGSIFDTNGFNIVVAQSLRHDSALGATADGGLRKLGAGELQLTAASTYTGPTQVNAGTLNLAGTAALSSSVTVASGATLRGTGSVDGNLTINGSLQPGSTLGTLTLVNDGLTLSAGSTSSFELGGGAPTLYDRVVGINLLTITGGVINVSLVNGFQPTNGLTFDLLDFTSVNAPGFNPSTQLLLPALSAGLSWNKNNFLTNGTIAVVIPEPSTATMILLGAVALSTRRRNPQAKH